MYLHLGELEEKPARKQSSQNITIILASYSLYKHQSLESIVIFEFYILLYGIALCPQTQEFETEIRIFIDISATVIDTTFSSLNGAPPKIMWFEEPWAPTRQVLSLFLSAQTWP